MVQTNSQSHFRKAERFTGPRRARFTSLTEARRDAELPAGEFEEEHEDGDSEARGERRDN